MAKRCSCSSSTLSKFDNLRRKSNCVVVIVLGLSLAMVCPPFVSGQTNQQQQEQQQREEQQRQEQAREQQQREQQERDRQAREEQQREEQQREEQQRQEQTREQQQREQAERDRQAREEQQRQEQQRAEQQRQEQERQRPTPMIPVHVSPVSSAPVPSHGATPAGSNPDLRPRPCAKEPCVVPKPVQPDRFAKLCKDKPCPVCAPGQSPGKDNSCIPVSQGNGANASAKPNALPHACVAGQVWNGFQCAPIFSQCLPGETNTGGSCHADCSAANAGAQSYIQRLRMARQDKDSACLKDPTGDECRSADATYQMRLTEYRNYLGGVSTQCTLPDPISI